MKIDRSNLEGYLLKNFAEILSSKDLTKKVYEVSKEEFNYDEVRFIDILSNRITITEISDFELFIIAKSILDILDINSIVRYYTDEEIKAYSATKWKKARKVKFPMKLRMIQIANDQWIGRITAKELVNFRNSGLIRYNENIQRTMKRNIQGEKVEYRIMENKKSTKEIRNSMEAGTFIPNTLTLNIPDDDFSEFYYNEEEMLLVIKKVKNLDIIDGFHRLIALEQAANINPKFDYPMELRISHYSENKGQRFVYQEDQKTKMSKIDSSSYNVESEAVKVVRRLNEDSLCNLYGEINRNQGLISFGEMSVIIDKLYFKGLNKTDARLASRKVLADLIDDLNWLTEADQKYMTERYSWKTLCIVLVGFKYLRDYNVDPGQKPQIMLKVLNNAA